MLHTVVIDPDLPIALRCERCKGKGYVPSSPFRGCDSYDHQYCSCETWRPTMACWACEGLGGLLFTARARVNLRRMVSAALGFKPTKDEPTSEGG